MLEQKWDSGQIREAILKQCSKSKLETVDMREIFLLFAIKRKLKLMSFLINSEEFQMEFTEINFIDVLENSAYDIGVLLYREYFLIINDNTDKIITLLVNSF